MGRLVKEYLPGEKVYTCAACNVPLSRYDLIVSKAFQGRHGRAYLFERCANCYSGPKEERMLMTGLHTVADLFCCVCHQSVGWQYLETAEESQRYKIGRVILEKAKLAKDGWGAARSEEGS